MKKIKYAIIGVGNRGKQLCSTLITLDGVDCVAVCDLRLDFAENASKWYVDKGFSKPAIYTDYKKCIDESGAEAIIVSTAWEAHTKVTLYAIEKRIPVACEVGGAYSINQLWELVNAQEKYETPVMLLENCCYGRLELMALNMKRLGVFGEIVQCEGAYCHDLRGEVVLHGTAKNLTHYRLEEYKHRNTENYPTHEIGPIAKILDINCGNKFTYLHSFSTKSVGIEAYIKDQAYKHVSSKRFTDEERDANAQSLAGTKFLQGDIITTVIGCQNGENVVIHLDTCLPRNYSRRLAVHGTKAFLNEENNSLFLDNTYTPVEEVEWHKNFNNVEKYQKDYDHRIWADYNPDENDGHGGMDYLVLNAFFDALKENKPMPIDIYDMATWMAIAPLAEESIATNNTVYFPDFTNGKWIRRKNEFEL